MDATASSSATRALNLAFSSASVSGFFLGVVFGGGVADRGPRSAQRPVCTVGGLLALAPAGRIVVLLYVCFFRSALRRAAFICQQALSCGDETVFQAPRQEKLATTVHSNGQVCHNGQCYDA